MKMYTLSIHLYGIMCDEGGGAIMVKNSVMYFMKSGKLKSQTTKDINPFGS